MEITVLCFGMIAEQTGFSKQKMEVEQNSTVSAFRQLLFAAHPKLETQRFKISVNQQLVDGEALLTPHAEVALLPPFAGG